ncbi:MAG: hypothetical protein PHV34_11800 [Verrucomicrobiae bacterium]|nr:hypothetical protein [Verrucomicrobiae bacterium]
MPVFCVEQLPGLGPGLIHERGGILAPVLASCFLLSLLAAVAALEMSRNLDVSRGSSAVSAMEQATSALFESLAAGYYQETQTLRGQGGSLLFGEEQAAQVVRLAGARLGVAANQGTEFAFSPGMGKVYATVNLTLPDGAFDLATPAACRTITNTFSWWDGLQAAQRPLTCVVQLRTATPCGGFDRTLAATNTLVFCQAPVRQLPVTALGALQLPNQLVSEAQGTVYIGGQVRGGAGLNVTGGMVTGDAATAELQQAGQDIRFVQSGWEYRGYTEMAREGPIRRNAEYQRVVSPGVGIRPDWLFREGLAGTLADAQESAVVRNTQPYYTVPSDCRLFGIHHPAAATPQTLFVLNAGGGDDARAATLPPWAMVTNHVDADGVNRVILLIDPAAIMPDAGGHARVFVGSRYLDGNGMFKDFQVQVRSTPVFPSNIRSFTLITPNELVFLGDFNAPASGDPIPTSIYAAKTFYGTTPMSDLRFAGNVAHLGGMSNSSCLAFSSSGGLPPDRCEIRLGTAAFDSTRISGAELYYEVVLRMRR